jgi:sugar phosphate isomerase/epimerase
MGYKLGSFSDDLHSQFTPAAEMAAAYGLDGLAVRNVGGRNIVELPAAEIRQIAATARQTGLEIASVGTQYGRGFYLDDDDAQSRAEAILSTSIRYAEILNTPLLRTFALWLPGQEELQEWTRRPALEEFLDQLVTRLTPSIKMAERAGMTMMFELEGASFVGQVAEARQLFTALDSPAVALCWDVCNGWWSGESPLDGLRGLTGLKIVDVQTKDVPSVQGDPTCASFGRSVVGMGDIPYESIIPSLIESGYDGYFTVERVYHPQKPEEHPKLQQDTVADIENLKRIAATSKKKEINV